MTAIENEQWNKIQLIKGKSSRMEIKNLVFTGNYMEKDRKLVEDSSPRFWQRFALSTYLSYIYLGGNQQQILQ